MLQPRAMFRHGRRLRCKGALLQAAITFTLGLAPRFLHVELWSVNLAVASLLLSDSPL